MSEPSTITIRIVPSVAALNLLGIPEIQAFADALTDAVNNDLTPAWFFGPYPELRCVIAGPIQPGWPLYLNTATNLPEGWLGTHTYGHAEIDLTRCRNAYRHWTEVASHECFELLINPYNNRQMTTAPDTRAHVNVCDPVNGTTYTTPGHPNTPLANFVLPPYFTGHAGPYDHNETLRRPRNTIPTGYQLITTGTTTTHVTGQW